MKMASKNLTSLETEVLFSELYKGKSVILTASAVELWDLLKPGNVKNNAVNSVFPEGHTITEIRRNGSI